MSAENARVILFGLLDSCPFEYDENCPIKDVRKQTEAKKHAWARSLSLKEVNEVVEQHERCFWERMEQDKA